MHCHVWQDLLHAPTRCHTPSLYRGDRINNANLERSPLRRDLRTINQCTSNSLHTHIVQGRQCRKGWVNKVSKILYISIIYTLDVLWCQPIKLIQVVSTSEYHEYWWNKIDFIFCPLHLLQGLRSNNMK